MLKGKFIPDIIALSEKLAILYTNKKILI